MRAPCRMRDAGMSAADIAREAADLHSRSHGLEMVQLAVVV